MSTNTVLVGADGSAGADRALAWTAAYALQSKAPVIVAHVLTYSAEFARDLPPTGLTNWRRVLRDRLNHDWTERLLDAGVEFHTVLQEDEAVDRGLIKLADAHDVALIVLGAHGRGDLADRLLGAVTYRVSHQAHRPVVIVPVDWASPL